jgi:phosphopantothenoylcysteine decarboxylase / phosphopantothenate---cysteine ligase
MAAKKVLIGISGSIAAYKITTLIRLLVKNGHEVKCIMTEAACQFISPLTIATLSKNKVNKDLFDQDTWISHVELGLWADIYLIAPATANTLSKLANGAADNMLIATYLSMKCPVIIAPAMDLDMWQHPSTLRNIELLKSYGNEIIPVGKGELASGLIGDGRLAEPEEMFNYLMTFFSNKQRLKGKKVLITAGPTYEHLDPVRYIGNHSSGKMGIAIANKAADLGAEVILVLGPSNQKVENQGIKVIKVQSADQMFQACDDQFAASDVVIFSAAVADYKPKTIADQKIKKNDPTLSIELVKNIDIAATLGSKKTANQTIVGFALETNDEEENAIKKIHKKNFDFVVLNSMNDKGAGFGLDTNKITIIHKDGNKKEFGVKSKLEVAADIIEEIISINTK